MTLTDDRLLLTREEAADRLGIGLNKLDRWTWEPGFPVIREGTHFVRIHAGKLDAWVAARAGQLDYEPDPEPEPAPPPPPPKRGRGRPRKQQP